jgi:hypothetical protein
MRLQKGPDVPICMQIALPRSPDALASRLTPSFKREFNFIETPFETSSDPLLNDEPFPK